MARDTRDPKLGLDRNKYYKAEYVNQNKLTQDAECKGVFYSRDFEPIKQDVNWVGAVQNKVKRVRLETNDYIPDLETDDFVLYNGELWLVETLETSDIIDNAKPYLRHSNKTIVGLRK